MFRVYDYSDVTILFGESFITNSRSNMNMRAWPEPAAELIILVEGFDVRITLAGHYILTRVNGKAMPVNEEYKERLAAKLVEEAPTLEAFRSRWIVRADRKTMLVETVTIS